MIRRSPSLLVLGCVLFPTLLSCGGDSDDSGGRSDGSPPDSVVDAVTTTLVTVPPNGESVEVVVLDNSYRPLDLEIEAGTEVVFDNRGRNEHNILPDSVKNDAELTSLLENDPSPSSWGIVSTEFAPTMTYAHVFTYPGTYPYYCSIHGAPGAGMYGTITVN